MCKEQQKLMKKAKKDCGRKEWLNSKKILFEKIKEKITKVLFFIIL